MLTQFSAALQHRLAILYGRRDNPEAPFSPIPNDTWPLFSISSWEDGIITGPNASIIYSVFLAPARQSRTRKPKTAGRKFFYDRTLIWPKVLNKFVEVGGPPSDGQEIGWQSVANLEDYVRTSVRKYLGKLRKRRLRTPLLCR
jgi:hypothetical protein